MSIDVVKRNPKNLPIIKMGLPGHILNWQELFEGVPWVGEKMYPGSGSHPYTRVTRAWLRRRNTVLRRNAYYDGEVWVWGEVELVEKKWVFDRGGEDHLYYLNGCSESQREAYPVWRGPESGELRPSIVPTQAVNGL